MRIGTAAFDFHSCSQPKAAEQQGHRSQPESRFVPGYCNSAPCGTQLLRWMRLVDAVLMSLWDTDALTCMLRLINGTALTGCPGATLRYMSPAVLQSGGGELRVEQQREEGG